MNGRNGWTEGRRERGKVDLWTDANKQYNCNLVSPEEADEATQKMG